jgi:stage II sporulation protein GA (sporulation sigma-E factor processing peptidase)
VIVYLDLLFLLNALADYVLLFVAGRLAGARVRHLRLIGAAALGGLYACAEPLGILPWVFGPVGVLGAAALVLTIAYAPVPWRQALRLGLAFLGAAIALAGAVFALVFLRAAGTAAGLPWWALALPLGAAVVAAQRYGSRALRRWRAAPQALVPIAVGVDGREIELTALVDTGNRLRDPLGQDPVLVVEARALRSLLPPELLPSATGRAAVWADIAEAWEGSPWAARLRVIPYSALGTEGGLLIGFRPDRALVAGCPVAPTVGLATKPLDPDGRYQALCPAVLLHPSARAS